MFQQSIEHPEAPVANMITEQTHKYHRQGDISIRSQDNVILWADSWRLADASTVFRDMFEIPEAVNENGKRERAAEPVNPLATSGPGRNAISLDYTADTISAFLDLTNVSTPGIPMTMRTFNQAKDLYEMCDQYDVTKKIMKRVKEQLMARSAEDPWALLIFASKRDNVDLAREALKTMSRTHFFGGSLPQTPMYKSSPQRVKQTARTHRGPGTSNVPPVVPKYSLGPRDVAGQFWQRMNEMPSAWQLALIQLTFTVPPWQEEDETSVDTSDGWAVIAADFKPGSADPARESV
ncbi:hypothetical protein IAU59_000872 [Kwoniella sp. CBS 9459]